MPKEIVSLRSTRLMIYYGDAFSDKCFYIIEISSDNLTFRI